MPGRVLSTEQAKTSIQQVQAIITGGLSDQIAQNIVTAGGGA